jgi:hypothetical protein
MKGDDYDFRRDDRVGLCAAPSNLSRPHGSSLDAKLRKFCNGVRYRRVFS